MKPLYVASLCAVLEKKRCDYEFYMRIACLIGRLFGIHLTISICKPYLMILLLAWREAH